MILCHRGSILVPCDGFLPYNFTRRLRDFDSIYPTYFGLTGKTWRFRDFTHKAGILLNVS